MANYDFYVSNKKIKEDSKECMNSVWTKSLGCSAFILILFFALVAATVILSLKIMWILAIPMGLFTLFIISFFGYGYESMGLKIARQDDFSFGIMFAGFGNFKSVFGILIKKFFMCLLWFVMAVVPFVVNAVGYSMANLLMIDSKEYNSGNALKQSKHILKKNYGRFIKFLFSNIHWHLLILVTGGIAFLWIGQLLVTRKALFYENLKTDF